MSHLVVRELVEVLRERVGNAYVVHKNSHVLGVDRGSDLSLLARERGVITCGKPVERNGGGEKG